MMYDKSDIPVLNRLPMTGIRWMIAHTLYRILTTVLRKDRHVICRKGIRYDVDLSEAFDMSVFLFGNFQEHVVNPKYFTLPKDAVILDVGANYGLLSLPFAQLVPQGMVYAFEPTAYAFAKLRRNLSLNSELAQRIKPFQVFVSAKSDSRRDVSVYSSWKVDDKPANAHPVHGGAAQSVDHVETISIDDFCEQNQLARIDFIKIDTDGHEFSVLRGARRTLEKYSPVIIFEVGLYLLDEYGVTFEEYADFFAPLGYALLNSKNGAIVTNTNYWKQIPLRATTDLLGIPACR